MSFANLFFGGEKMKYLKVFLFIIFTGCSVSLFKGEVPMLKDETSEISAPYPRDPMIGLSFDAISRDKNAVVFASLQGGYTWKGEAKFVSPDTQIGIETKFTYFQGSINFGVVPFYKIKPFIYPYVGIGLGILNMEAYGIYEGRVISMIYPYLRGGMQVSFPFPKKCVKRRKSNFHPSLNITIGYQFSFERWLQGPYFIAGYSGFFPPEGIWAILLGSILIFIGG